MAVNYRWIYQKHYGPIPKGYDIHHRDGDHGNCDISNLVAVTLQEHYDIHFAQGDTAACQAIAMRMSRPPETVSELAKKRVAEGTHPFQDKEAAKQRAYKRIAEGTHPFFVDDFQKKNNKKRVEAGTHNMLGPALSKKRLAEDTHPSQKLRTCPHCNKQGKAPGIFKWHFDKCSEKQLCL